MNRPGEVANPARGQLNGENENFCLGSRLRVSSREKGSAVPSRVSLLIFIPRLNLVLTHGILSNFHGGVYLFNPPYPIGSVPSFSGHAVEYRWRSLPRVHGTGPVVLKVVPVTGAASAGRHGLINVRLYFPTPTIGIKWVC